MFTSYELSDHEPPSKWDAVIVVMFLAFCAIMAVLTSLDVAR